MTELKIKNADELLDDLIDLLAQLNFMLMQSPSRELSLAITKVEEAIHWFSSMKAKQKPNDTTKD